MKRYFFYSCLIIWFLNVFDFMSTVVVLENGGEEMNLVADLFIKLFGIIGGLLILKVPFLALLTYTTHRACKKPTTKRERVALSSGYALIIAFYTYFMYNYNWMYIRQL